VTKRQSVDIASADVETLVRVYREAAVAHGVATEHGNYRAANRQHDVLAEVYRELRNRGRDSQVELLPLLDDIDAHVRAWVAAHALEFAPDRGEAVLKRLASGEPSVIRLNAEMTLSEWKKGSLAFP
jgi:hypothetical protein